MRIRILTSVFLSFFVFAIPSALATTPSDVGSIDQCLKHRTFTYNDVFNIWVDDSSLVRCVDVGGELRAQIGKYSGGADYVDSGGKTALELCEGKSKDEVLVHGGIQKDVSGRTFNGRVWEEKCSALGSLPGRNHLLSNSSSSVGTNTNTNVDDFFSGFGDTGGLTPRYTGGGLGVPDDKKYDLRGISKEKDLKSLVIGWTNFLLPYVSVLSVFAIVAAGLFYIVSFFNEELNAKAKNILIYVVIGIVLIFSAYTIVNTLLSFGQ
jgi:hypothetical protein